MGKCAGSAEPHSLVPGLSYDIEIARVWWSLVPEGKGTVLGLCFPFSGGKSAGHKGSPLAWILDWPDWDKSRFLALIFLSVK